MEDEFKAWHDYQAWLTDIPENLTYDEIHEALLARIPYVARREATRRVFEESGINNLLDQLNALLVSQCVELLETEANEEPLYGTS